MNTTSDQQYIAHHKSPYLGLLFVLRLVDTYHIQKLPDTFTGFITIAQSCYQNTSMPCNPSHYTLRHFSDRSCWSRLTWILVHSWFLLGPIGLYPKTQMLRIKLEPPIKDVLPVAVVMILSASLKAIQKVLEDFSGPEPLLKDIPDDWCNEMY